MIMAEKLQNNIAIFTAYFSAKNLTNLVSFVDKADFCGLGNSEV